MFPRTSGSVIREVPVHSFSINIPLCAGSMGFRRKCKLTFPKRERIHVAIFEFEVTLGKHLNSNLSTFRESPENDLESAGFREREVHEFPRFLIGFQKVHEFKT